MFQLVGTREKFERLQEGFEQDIEGLKNQIKENEKYINHLKDQVVSFDFQWTIKPSVFYQERDSL